MRVLALLAAFLLFALPTAAQTSGTPVGDLLRADGTVDAARAAGVGALDLAGFDVSMTPDGLRAVPQTASRAPGDWTGFGGPGGQAFDNGRFAVRLSALAVAPDGTVYTAGQFTSVAGIPTERIAAYDAATETWSEVGGGVSGGINVNALAVAPDGTLYAGGDFTSAGGVAVSRIAAYDPATDTWSPLGTGVTGRIQGLALAADGTLYVTGSFTNAGGVSADRIASYDTATGTWAALGIGLDDTGEALLLDEANDALYVGGWFDSAGGLAATKVARYDLAAGTWSRLGSGVDGGSSFSRASALALGTDGTLYVTGEFDTAGGVAVTNVAAWNGATWSALGAGLPEGRALAFDAAGTLFAGSLESVHRWNGTAWTVDPGATGGRTDALVSDGTGVTAASSVNVQSWDGTAWTVLNPTAFNGSVRSATFAADGTVTVGGSFSTTPDGIMRGLASFDGTMWTAVGGGVGGSVLSLEVDDAGRLLVAGSFDAAGGTPAGNLARWDGTAWETFGGGADGTVSTFTQAADGSLYAAGSIQSVGGVPAAGVARWTGAAWQPLGSGVQVPSSGSIQDLLVASDGSVYVGGGQLAIAGSGPLAIAQWNGTSWAGLGSGLRLGPNAGIAYALAETPDGRIAAAGGFDQAGGTPIANVAAWNGVSWSALGSGGDTVFSDSFVGAVHVGPDDALYAGGASATVNDVLASGVARLDARTNTWVQLDSPLDVGAYILGFANTNESELAVFGRFTVTTTDGSTASIIATTEVRLPPTLPAEGWRALGDGTDASVSAVAVAPDYTMYAGGSFATAGGSPASRVATWDGFGWSPLGSGMNGTVSALTVMPDGTLYAGGTFTTAGGVAANRIARWDGSAWFALGSGASGPVTSMAQAPDGSLVVGGRFASVDGVVSPTVARYTPGTGVWTALGGGTNDSVQDVAVALDGTVYIVGEFSSAGGVAVQNVAAWDGSAWSALGSGLDGPAYAVVVGADGTVYAGGEFGEAGGVPVSGVARWDGSAWSAVGAGLGGEPEALVLDPLGVLYAGGGFSTSGGLNVARWDGAAWEALSGGTNGSVRALAHDRVGGLYVGGSFSGAGGAPASNVARWQTPISLTLDGAPGWRMLAAPARGISWQSVLEPIWTQGMPGSDNPDADPVTFCNVFQHDETVRTDTNNDGIVTTADGWSCMPSLGTAQAGESVLVYVFADDDNDGTADAFPKVLPIGGSAVAFLATLPFEVNDLSFTDSPILPRIQEGFNYVGNPTPLALDLDFFETTGLRATAYVWDPALFGGDYRTWNGAAGELADGILSPGQAFFLQADTPNPSVTIPAEATRTSGRPLYGKTGHVAPTVRFELARRAGGELFPEASAFVSLDPRAEPDLDRYDGLRLGTLRWPFASLYTLAPGGDTPLVVNALGGEPEMLNLPLGLQTGGYPDGLGFALTWDGLALADGWRADLLDTETGATVALDAPGRYDFELTGAGAAARTAPTTLAARPAPLARSATGERFVLRLTGEPLANENAPAVFAVGAPFPNPARGAVSLPLSLPTAGPVRVAVYDLLGREVAILADGEMPAGRETVRLETRGLAAGVYVVRVSAGDAEATRRISVIR